MAMRKKLVKKNWVSNDNQNNDSFYEQDFIDDCIDSGLISNEEAGFMQGYLGAE